jgi:hypothetical protein
MHFEIVGEISETKVIAVSRSIREIDRLEQQFGKGRWRKLKRNARVRLSDGTVRRAEIHWYEAHGIGKRKIKIKRFLD